jgi:hypothetical protein
MSWTPLSHRIHHLPLILAGPILRRTQTEVVTVWLALKAPRQVELKVYSTEGGTGEIVDRPLLQGANSTVQLGKYLHVVAVTAKPINSNVLTFGQIYAYDIEFAGSPESQSGVRSQKMRKKISFLACGRPPLICRLWGRRRSVISLTSCRLLRCHRRI